MSDIIDLASPIIKEFEGFSPSTYKDSVGVYTCGYGFTYWNGQRVTASYPGSITQTEADNQLYTLLNSLLKQLLGVVKVQLSDNQYAALLSLSYNIGFGNFRGSTLLRLINSGANINEAAHQFLVWNKAGDQVLDGLTRRREAEMQLFLRQ